MNEGLLRQRRNLIVICGLFWLLKFGQVEFSKFSLAGFDIAFNRPEALYLSLWITFAYFLYRYYQYFVKFAQNELIQQFVGAIDRLALTWMGQVHKDHPGWTTNTGYPKFRDLLRTRFVIRAEERTVVTQPESETRTFEERLSRWKVAKETTMALMESTFRSTVISDYILPFGLALFILFYCGSGEWVGGLSNVLGMNNA